jgi:glycosyltransferase involved in cell wall biosynthesis
VRFSVIIPTRNRRASLEASIEALAAQTFPREEFELIVVDDGSDDDTMTRLKRPTLPMPVRAVSVVHGGPGAARNAGAAGASGEYLAFTEDDVSIAPDWLQRAADHLLQHEIDVLEGRTLLEGTLLSTRRGEPSAVPSFIPCNLFVRRDRFERLGGYDPNFFDRSTGLYFREDADFGFRALEHGYTHEIDPAVVVEHPAQFASIAACFRHARRYVFDPLLYRRHHELYRKLIEVKVISGIRVHRPLHLVALLSLFGWIVAVAGAIFAGWAVLIIGVGLVLAAGLAARVKYQGRHALRVWNVVAVVAFTLLPLVYLGALVRGCVRARGGLGVFV